MKNFSQQTLSFLLLLTFIFQTADTFSHSTKGYSEIFKLENVQVDSPLIRNIVENVPEELKEQTLLIPRFDLLDPERAMQGEERKFIIAVNRQAKQGNSTLNKIAEKNYDYVYGLVTLGSIDSLKEKGYRYFVDMALMPKQMKYPKKEAMVPTYEKYKSVNSMFNNRYSQFVYYFYIRDLETNDAYITTKFRGNPEAYRGLEKFLKQVSSDLVE